MTVVVDPIWPWSLVAPFLAGARPATLTTLILLVLLALLVPILVRLRPWGIRGRQIVRGTAATLLLLLGLLVANNWGSTPANGDLLRALSVAMLLALPALLVGITIATYLRMPQATRRRTGTVLTLRLLALLLVAIAVVRPAVAFFEEAALQTVLLVVLDASRSMTIQDEADHLSRWEMLLRSLKESLPELERLHERQQVEVQMVRFHTDVAPFDLENPPLPDGDRTETGLALRWLHDHFDRQRPLRGLLLLTDGADNGTSRIPVLPEAERWRAVPCPVHTFACGKSTTSPRHSDVGITSLTTEPALVPLKSKVTIKLLIDALGFENTTVRLRVFYDDREVMARNQVLSLTTANEVHLECPAPEKAGEVKLTVRVEDPQREGEPPRDDLFRHNNQAETFITVSRQGIRVLLVDRWRWEPKFIARAVAADPRIQLETVYLGAGRRAGEGAGDLLQLNREHYDAILIGDITARQLQTVNPEALEEIRKMVEGGSGFMMLGGYASFGNSDWAGTPLASLVPVDLHARGQVDRPTRIEPTQDGLRKFSYLLRLEEGEDAAAAWDLLPELEGYNLLRHSETGGETVLAKSRDGNDLLISRNYGNGRTLAFAGDTTYRWLVNPRLAAMQSRFWRQIVLWLARQENAQGSVWVKPDTRRLPVRSELGFDVGVRSKGGVDLANGEYRVEVIGPDGAGSPVVVSHSRGSDRGTFVKTDRPGVYRIEVKGQARDPGGEEVKDTASARFIVYDEDLELLRRSADHDFLKKLASAGGGEANSIAELPAFLRKLQAEPQLRPRARVDLRPDWAGRKRSPFRIGFLLVFVALVSLEWLLRRRWDMV